MVASRSVSPVQVRYILFPSLLFDRKPLPLSINIDIEDQLGYNSRTRLFRPVLLMRYMICPHFEAHVLL